MGENLVLPRHDSQGQQKSIDRDNLGQTIGDLIPLYIKFYGEKLQEIH